MCLIDIPDHHVPQLTHLNDEKGRMAKQRDLTYIHIIILQGCRFLFQNYNIVI